ncbi:MAG: SMC-Scp complex subunit ScpB [Myxococcota bacterium]
MAKKKAVAAEAQDATNHAAEQSENAEQPETVEASAEKQGGKSGKSSVDREQQRRVVEAIILASPEPIAPARVAGVLPRCNPSQVRALVKELNAEYVEQRRAFEIWEVAGGYQLRSLPEFAPYLKQIQKTRPLRLSAPALETLAVVAYRQPVTRAEIEHIRGVDVGAVLRSLLDRQLVRIAGHREVPGRPIVYATSRRFLEVFGLAKLGDLPTLKAIESLADAEEEDAAEGAEGEITVELAPDEETEAAAADAEAEAEAPADAAAESAENEASDPEDTAGPATSH